MPRARRRPLLIVLAACVCSSAGCAYFQPQTYYLGTRRVARQQNDYLWNDLVTGMPEALFVRWYTRDENSQDRLRPYILGKDEEEGRTVYRVGSGHRTVMKVYFRDGRLEEIGQWHLTEESIFFYWSFYHRAPTPPATEAVLARLEGADPASDVLQVDAIEAARRPCDFEKGAVIRPLRTMVIRSQGKKRFLEPFSGVLSAGGSPLLPAGTLLTVKRWNMLSAVVVDGEGRVYRIDDPPTYSFCQDDCVLEGEQARITRDLLLAEPEPAFTPARGFENQPIATLPGFARLPVWMERRVLKQGTVVRLDSLSTCALKNREHGATIEVAGDGAEAHPVRYRIAMAPAWLFAPIAGGPPAGSAPGGVTPVAPVPPAPDASIQDADF